MKKTVKKLTISKETLSFLSDPPAKVIAGNRPPATEDLAHCYTSWPC